MTAFSAICEISDERAPVQPNPASLVLGSAAASVSRPSWRIRIGRRDCRDPPFAAGPQGGSGTVGKRLAIAGRLPARTVASVVNGPYSIRPGWLQRMTCSFGAWVNRMRHRTFGKVPNASNPALVEADFL